MSNIIDEIFDELEKEVREKEDLKYIKFAQKHKWNFERFKKLLSINLMQNTLSNDVRLTEDDYVREYKTFAKDMYEFRMRNFTVQKYMMEYWQIMPDNYIRVNEDMSIGKRYAIESQR